MANICNILKDCLWAMSRVKINYSLEVLNSRVIISLFYSYLSNCWYPNILEMSLAIFKWRRKENVLKKKPNNTKLRKQFGDIGCFK